MRIFLTTVIGKLSIKLLRLFGNNGSALPGLIAEKLYPQYMERLLATLPEGVVVVTGTNGKTTTTKSLVYLLEQCGRRVLTNPTGSNFTRGVYATLLQYGNWFGQLDYDIAVLELDEAFSRKFAARVTPRYVLALNVMRDQLDRYGEIDATARMIGETIAKASDGVILNGDDNRIRALAGEAKSKTHFYSVADKLRKHLPSDDELHGQNLQSAPKSSKRSRKKRAEVTLADYNHGKLGFRISGKTYRTDMHMSGIHNAQNITAALATALQVCPDMQPQFLVPTIKGIRSAFGRGETFRLGDTNITFSLVKNPSGMRQSLASYANEQFDLVYFVINDDFADGRDVSWLWDVSYQSLPKDQRTVAGGVRAYDMALRLDYDERPAQKVLPETKSIIAELQAAGKQRVMVYCTYTAMLGLRKKLSKLTEVPDIW